MKNLRATIAVATVTIILAAVAVSLSEQAANSSTTQGALNELQALAQNVRTFYSSSPGSYAGLSGCELQQVVPAGMIATGGACGNLANPWGEASRWLPPAAPPGSCNGAGVLFFCTERVTR